MVVTNMRGSICRWDLDGQTDRLVSLPHQLMDVYVNRENRSYPGLATSKIDNRERNEATIFFSSMDLSVHSLVTLFDGCSANPKATVKIRGHVQ